MKKGIIISQKEWQPANVAGDFIAITTKESQRIGDLQTEYFKNEGKRLEEIPDKEEFTAYEYETEDGIRFQCNGKGKKVFKVNQMEAFMLSHWG